MTVSEDYTPVQWEALKATAAQHLRDPEELGREIRPLVWIDPDDHRTPAPAGTDSAVKEDLTPTTELIAIRPETYAVTFYASGGPL